MYHAVVVATSVGRISMSQYAPVDYIIYFHVVVFQTICACIYIREIIFRK